MTTNSMIVPSASPALAKRIAILSAIYIIVVFRLSSSAESYVSKFLTDNGVAFHLAMVGVCATLAGFVVAGISIISTTLSKPDFLKSPLARYYEQIYNSFKSSVLLFVVVMLLGVVSAIAPKDNHVSFSVFYIEIFLFFSSLIAMWYSIGIIGDILSLDNSGKITQASSTEIEFTENETGADGALNSRL